MKRQEFSHLFIEKLGFISWRHLLVWLEKVGLLKGLLIKVNLVITGTFSTEIGLSAVHFARRVRYLALKSGWLYVALYLKQCTTSLLRYYALVSISLTRSGIPRIIPPYHRKLIMKRYDSKMETR